MGQLRKILLIGRDPFLVRDQLRAGGFTLGQGFEIIEAGGVEAGYQEVDSDASIVAVVIPGDSGTPYEIMRARAGPGHRRVPAVVAGAQTVSMLRELIPAT